MKKALIHAIAHCRDCDFMDDNYLTAQKSGRDHHIKTGHKVGIETAYVQFYEKEAKP